MTPRPLHPRAVQPGDTVAVVPTSSAVTIDELDRLVAYFEGRGHPVRVMSDVTDATTYVAGPASLRASALMAAFADPVVSLIVPASGGKGASHLIDVLDYDTIAVSPKVFTGMSDPSILGNAIYARTGMLTLHGPSGYDFFQPDVNAATEAAFWRIVTGPVSGTEVRGEPWRVVRGAGVTVTGSVVGGHLGTIRALVGTPWMPDLDGAILILEEVFAPWVTIDAGLTHLRLAGVFDRIAALVVGVPEDCPRDDAPDTKWDEMILRCTGSSVPVVTNVEFGHTARKIPLPIGGRITLDLAAEAPSLRYVDDLVDAST